MGRALQVDDDDAARMLQIEIVHVQAAADAALAAIRQARAGRDKAAVMKLRVELRQWRERITQLVDAAADHNVSFNALYQSETNGTRR